MSPCKDEATRQRNLATPEYDYRTQDWYQRSLRTEAAWLSAPYLNDTSGGVWVVTYNVPLRRFDKSPLGMVSIDLPLDHLRDIAAALGLPGGDQRQRGSIIDAEGLFVQAPNAELELKTTVDEFIRTRGRADLKPWFDGIASGKPGWFEHTAPDGTRRTTTYAPIGATGWSVASSIDHAELLAPLQAEFLKLVAIGLAGFALLALLVWIVAQRIVRPLEALTDSAAHFARGEFDWPLPRHDARDEVGVLVQALGHARDSLKQYVANLADATAARQKIESELAIAREIQMAMLPHQRELAAGGARLEAAAAARTRAPGRRRFLQLLPARRAHRRLLHRRRVRQGRAGRAVHGPHHRAAGERAASRGRAGGGAAQRRTRAGDRERGQHVRHRRARHHRPRARHAGAGQRRPRRAGPAARRRRRRRTAAGQRPGAGLRSGRRLSRMARRLAVGRRAAGLDRRRDRGLRRRTAAPSAPTASPRRWRQTARPRRRH